MSVDNKFLRPDDQDDNQKEFKALGELRSMFWLLQFAKQYRLPLFFAVVLLMMESLVLIFSANLMGAMVEKGLMTSNLAMVYHFAWQVLALEVFGVACQWAGRAMIAYFSGKTLLNVRAALFAHLQRLPMQFFDRTPQGRVITRLTHDVEGIEDFFTTAIGKVLGAIFTGIVALVAMIYTSGWSGVIIFSSIIPAFFLLYGTRTMQGKLNRGMGRSTSMINGQLSEFISGQEVIRSLGLERWSMEQFKLTALFQRNIHLESNLYFSWSRPVLSFLCTLPIVGLVWLGGNQVLSGVMSVGVFVAFLRYCERFINPVMVVARDFHIVQQALINAERVAQFLKRPPEDEVFGLDGQHQNAIIRGSIEFNNVGLIYSGAQGRAIDKVTFNVLPGERIGIVGKTGSGKSSVIALLARLYEYQEGSILIDQVEMRQWRRAHLRRHIGVVAQDPVLFRGSIRDNLALELEFTPEQIAECTMQTGLSHVLARSGLSLDSMILDAGVNLSVGERQLVVITRMLLRNPAILILDEATANIDPYHEHIVHEAINRLMTGRTCLIVAHRLATLKECHRVLVFSQGHLVEEGTLEELEQRRGYFYQLQCAQGTAELL